MRKRAWDSRHEEQNERQSCVPEPQSDEAEFSQNAVQERFYTLRVFLFVLLLAAACFLLSDLLRRCTAGNEDTGAGGQVQQYPITVVLDAGHGGFDGGAVSVTGSLEKDLNLELAFQLRDLLEAAGVKVIMTRTEDRMLTVSREGDDREVSRKADDLQGRLRILSEHPEAFFISLHMNKFPQASARGVQVYYSPNHPLSGELALGIQEAVRDHLQPENNRAVKKADSSIFLLYRAQNPAVLIECGFLSNPEEAKLLDDPQYRQSLACVLCAAVLSQLPAEPAV